MSDFPPPPPPPVYAIPVAVVPVDPLGRPLAEWWKRLVAYLIDSAIISVPLGIVISVFSILLFIPAVSTTTTTEFDTVETNPPSDAVVAGLGLGLLVVYGLSFLVPFLYFTIMNGGASGQTVGKKIMKIATRDAHGGGPVGYGRSFLRYLLMSLIGVFTCGIGSILDVLWPLWDAQRQTLHDKVATTLVVEVG